MNTTADMLPPTFQPETVEPVWRERWTHAPSSAADGKPYGILLPPPNVTGSLHMGHAFQDTLMDLLIRYHRMKGFKTHWQLGTDHAGIATQMVVDKQWQRDGRNRRTEGRDAFVSAIWDWKEHSGGTILKQMKRLGVSADCNNVPFTLDAGPSRAVREVFVRLHDAGLIYRGHRLVNWDPSLQTAVSDLEVVPEARQGMLYHVHYPLASGEPGLTVASTRPETLFGDVAVAVHPEDPRYQTLVGHELRVPLTDRTIPIVADDQVAQDFGTGCVKITPAHDFFDFELGKRHQLPTRCVLHLNGTLNDQVPEAFQGLSVEEARQQVVAALATHGALTLQEEHPQQVPVCERTGCVVEPMLTLQWFVKCDTLAEAASQAVRAGDLRFVPQNWENTFFDWMNRIDDWCISRQLWWGHRIPAWYADDGTCYVGHDEADVRAKHHLGPEIALTQDEDVLDTWFSSALWPFAALGWPDNTPALKLYYPTEVLVTGFDIIFFWVARMIMMGLFVMKQVPFKTVYVHGLIQDDQGQKMSKSKGNVLDPLDLIDGIDLEALCAKRTQGMMLPSLSQSIVEHTKASFPEGLPASGTDALRMTFCAMASGNRHLRFELSRLAGYKHFTNKLWNAARFVMMQTPGGNTTQVPVSQRSLEEQALFTELNMATQRCEEHIAAYRFDWLAQTLYEVTWHRFCDVYLELAKSSNSPTMGASLLEALRHLITLLHPVMPFVTEALNEALLRHQGQETTLLTTQTWPEATFRSPDALATLQHREALVLALRQIRSELVLPPKQTLAIRALCSDDHWALLQNSQSFLTHAAKVATLTRWTQTDHPEAARMAVVGGITLWVPLAGLIDPKAEQERLNKALMKLKKEQERAESKLNNTHYVAKAPPEVVAQEREKLQAFKDESERLDAYLEQLKHL